MFVIDSSSANAHPIENCVRVLGSARSLRGRSSIEHESVTVSVAISAVIIYLCIILVGSQLYNKFCGRAADALPNNVDVLVAGSSVVASPLMQYEFPGKNSTLLADRSPILEAC